MHDSRCQSHIFLSVWTSILGKEARKGVRR
uniref:Uncharacterized protein n=1 Tax=Anguilla anguilla TaxID=7936 RepID=A0A0E9QR67_ANGAN